MTFHTEVLNENQRSILPTLGPFAGKHGFCLGGGTAVALYLGHRKSVDFDWFAPGQITDPLVLAGQARQHALSVSDVHTAPGTLHATVGGVRVSFFDYPYPEIGQRSEWEEYKVAIASLDDLACMKLAAVAQRGSRKDFIDLYFLALEHKPIGELLNLYKSKYDLKDIVPVLLGLNYFEDADDEAPPVMLREARWDQIKREFDKWSRSLE
jgi:hypothetical protein